MGFVRASVRESRASSFNHMLDSFHTSGGNMKKLILLCIVLFTLPVAAQIPGPSISFGVQGDMINANLNTTLRQILNLPQPTTIDFALEQVYGLGLGGGAHLDLDLGLLSFRLAGDYVTLSPDKEKFKRLITLILPGAPIEYVDGGTINIITGSVNVKFTILPLPVVKPYITGGGGIANISTTAVKLRFNNVDLPPFELLKKQTVGTLNAGVGSDIVLGGLTLYAELKVNKIFLEEGSGTFIPIATVGLTF
jgi:hypothetical protein